MSMASYEPDRDYGDEDAYEQHRDRIAEAALDEAEDAYLITDPKNPRHYDTLADLWDNRDKTAGIA